MNQATEKVTVGCLLHDIGKLIYRAGALDGRSHSKSGHDFIADLCPDEAIRQCIRFHHKKELVDATLPPTSPAYITYIADNIAAGADRRVYDSEKEEEFKKDLPLYSVFNLLNGVTEGKSVAFANHLETIPLPTAEPKSIPASEYSKLVADMRQSLSAVDYQSGYVNSILEIMESYTSFVPSSTNTKEIADISLFDHSKITACVGSCISEFLQAQGIEDYKTALLTNEKQFLDKKAFLMLSFDLSGIQSFIYSIDYEDALKSLRMRSFFLEILMEHSIDTLLEKAGLSRVNLIYSGGGHCYILLPNTDEVKTTIKTVTSEINRWLMQQFEASLHLAVAYVECSGNDLMNHPAKDRPYANIFVSLSRQLNQVKMHKYSGDDIRLLNQPFPASSRECRICGKVSVLTDKNVCHWCDTFSSVSNTMFSNSVYVVTKTEVPGWNGFLLPGVPGHVYLYAVDEPLAKEQISSGNALRVYSKNKPCTGLRYANKIFVGDYVFSNLICKLVTGSEGVKRIAVLRMDVDNLGLAFMKGFERASGDVETRYRYVTLSRTATFSRQLTMFFKYYINQILRDYKDGQNRVSIVYSGGDDVFLLGAWEDVIGSAVRIDEIFQQYTMNRLTLSAGIGIFREKYPVFKSARETEALEEKSKSRPDKNAITLFTTKEDHTYRWDVFRDKVMGEKLRLIKDFMDQQENERGTAFLYRLLSLLRESGDKINIARYAYYLAKMEPKNNRQQYTIFSQKMYEWILNKTDKQQLITAMYTYLYQKRKRSER